MSDKLKEIAKASMSGDVENVRQILSSGLNYRDAYLYVELFHKDNLASLLIQEEGKCVCGKRAIKWKPKPQCASCSFDEEMDKIEYGTPVQK